MPLTPDNHQLLKSRRSLMLPKSRFLFVRLFCDLGLTHYDKASRRLLPPLYNLCLCAPKARHEYEGLSVHLVSSPSSQISHASTFRLF